MKLLDSTRDRLGAAVFARVAGPDGPRQRDRIHGRPGPRWFEPDSAIVRVHGDASMFVGGIRALLLQTMHPAAMRAVSEHSGFRGDMLGRLAPQREAEADEEAARDEPRARVRAG